MATLVDLGLRGLFGVVGLWMILVGAGRVRTWNKLRGSSVERVSSPGFVEVEGTAQPIDETVQSPVTNTESIVYEYSVEERHHDSDGADSWRTIESDRDAVPFVIESERGGVVVDPSDLDGEDTYLDGTETREGDRKRTESRLEPGEPAYAAGTAVRAGAADVRTDGHQFVVTGGGDGPLPVDLAGLVSDQFVLSDSGEEDATSRQLKDGLVLLVAVGYFAPI